ncbi:immune inhibitor A domain-containing protein [Paractinoplanes hotanensis]|uniref:Immune inhibitor A n=1 Tax=Paractinoplanes hotanensis TaxID=2906497 RepID=A0ABT0Y0R2_9ACTN|nr:immune inhibitor A domain-containing protein [Actinoplanes hotanensis]MCM4079630.1 immune inhibitor A [Actinoplanes hotanensis]
MRFVAILAIVLVVGFPVPAQAQAAATLSDVRELTRTHLTLDEPRPPRPKGRSAAGPTPPVGTVREWLGLDDTTGKLYRKNYTLKAVGRHVEVWVAQDLAFPATDCRKNAIEVTDADIAALVDEFDTTIHPKETAVFSTPPDRDGTRATTEGDFTGDGDKTVTLVDNIRDANYYTFPEAVTYIAGFFSQTINELLDRNVLTLDAYDWKHRLGAQPADDPTDDLCTSRPARPRTYEATFAHEWQHLLGYYTDPAESTWLDEGLADFASALTGYTDARAGVDQPGNDTHLMCFQGHGPVKTRYNANPRDCGGPQNSLNLWDEGTPSEVLADYGNAFQFVLYLRDRFGTDVVSMLHRDKLRQGLAAVQAALPAGVALYDVLHDYQLMTLVDGVVGESGGTVAGAPLASVSAAGLRSSINLDNKSAFDAPGAAPNGADYVPLPTPLTSVSFAGATHLDPLPLGWTIAGKTLYSGNRNNLDSYAVRPVTIPAGRPALTLETSYATEERNDFGYVTISTNGGRTFHSVTGDRTTPGPHGPGLTGASGGVVTVKYNLTPYAGKDVLLGLRYVTDGAVSKGGWRIGAMTLAGRTLSDGATLTGWTSPSAIVPTPVHNWHVRLVGLRDRHAEVVTLDDVTRLTSYPRVVAVVSHDAPSETETRSAPYRLIANGALQPGGSPAPAGEQPYAGAQASAGARGSKP